MMLLTRNFLIFFLFIFLTLFVELKSNNVSDLSIKTCEKKNDTYKFPINDLVIPPKTCFYLNKTIFIGAYENWFGEIYFSSKLDLNSLYNSFKKLMPHKGWILVIEQRMGSEEAKEALFIYEKNNRTATITLKEKDNMSEFIVRVSPSEQ
tara:strand:+ start:759 stop:1208 length:450 start_codon:yes stop_codon:yes gene_type:complete